jgi:hypothetical protein
MKRLLLLGALLAAGCKTNPYCLDCTDAEGTHRDLSMQDMAEPLDFAPQPDIVMPLDMLVLNPEGGICMPTNNGVEICDHIDNDCNGTVDDVDPSKLTMDPNNCGACFNACDYTTTHQEGVCAPDPTSGKPTCSPGKCLPGYVTIPGQAACAYKCTPTADPTEICDGKDNDCNGVIDDPFGYPNYALDPQNCGACGNVCQLPGAVAKCVADPKTGAGLCAVDHCINDGTNTYRDPNYTPGTINTVGCLYHCPTASSTSTPGSDCDQMTCAFPMEVCNGLDDDCDFVVDDNLTDTNIACASKCPMGQLANCVGQCTAGLTMCFSGVLSCVGSMGPSPETCDGVDNDCDGTTDDHLADTWVGQACCPTGNIADCSNTNNGTRCAPGAYQCVTGARQCTGGTVKSAEICNGADDDCDGSIDDVPGLNTACTGMGVNTLGICTATFQCFPMTPSTRPDGLTCTQKVGPLPGELCNGLDDNCDGTTDNNPTDVGGSCANNCPGGNPANCVGACTTGTMVCNAGARSCSGSMGPSPEICDGIDNDCNGTVDDVPGIGGACSGAGIFTTGACVAKFVCTGTFNAGGPSGLTCQQIVGKKAETCNGVDDDCDGTIDDNLTDPGVNQPCGGPCPGGLVTNCKGICQPGNLLCTNGALVCTGGKGGTAESCNSLDDDCDGTTDDNLTDTWVNQVCCPTGNATDCANTSTGGVMGTRCQQGSFQCVSGTKSCSGGISKTAETCNGFDDDCNGRTDDVPGVGTSCTAAGIINQGACTSQLICDPKNPGPVPGGLTCVQKTGPSAETCNGIDDNCNGSTDEGNPGGGIQCGQNCPGGQLTNCKGQCVPGMLNCTNGTLICTGSTGPSTEICDGIDNNCNGVTDGASELTDTWINQVCCPTGNATDCQNSGGSTRCRQGSFQCVAGGKLCSGGTAKSAEICNSIDDDCDGSVDDVQGIGLACTGGTVNTTGACTAAYTCTGTFNPGGPGGLTCSQVVGPRAETCNGVDDNCNGTIDEGNPGGGAQCGLNCPTGQPSGCIGACAPPGTTVCTNGALVCNGSKAPTAEVCNGIDDNCDGTTDNNVTDSWNGTPCCSTGNIADCSNTGSGSRCAVGSFICSAGTRVCNGSTTKSVETCNGIDDDCNGIIDDVPLVNTNCTGGGTNNQGACTAQWKCAATPGPGPGGLTCTQIVGPTAEICNGIDDNCDGTVDNSPSGVGAPCGQNCPTGLPAGCKGQCQVGSTACVNGAIQCNGSTGPSPEICNGLDDNCDGTTDGVVTDSWYLTQCCPTGNIADCTNTSTGGVTGTRCAIGTFICQAGTRTCNGATAKSSETCNNIDDDCNGSVDDVPLKNTACSGTGINTTGACTAQWRCGASPGTGPGGLTCTQVVAPTTEVCNNIDDNCDGTVDNNTTGSNQPCGQNCPGGLPSGCRGACVAGNTACVSGTMECVGSTGPTPEVCNNIDDNCDGTTDNAVTDPWAGQTCCSTGNNADCTNTGTGTRCRTSTYSCTAGAKTCANSIAKSAELCDGIDNDCNGPIDDVPGLNSSCTGTGINTTGACVAQWQCRPTAGPGPGNSTCIQLVAPTAEICNGIDDNCNGTTDDSPTGVNVACGSNCPNGNPANCVGVCKSGLTACNSGVLVCNGSTGPSPEVCDSLDNNCNGTTDGAAELTDPWLNTQCCPDGVLADCQNTTTGGITGTRCRVGSNICQAGARVCNNAVQKATSETCNGIDDDCNGPTDDIASINSPCTGGGTNTTGACTAQWKCTGSVGPGPQGLTCTQLVGPAPTETCNGLDDNCNGTTDEGNPGGGTNNCGGTCAGTSNPANCVGQCKLGNTTCTNGVLVCTGAVGPTADSCNGLDDDCNGTTDDGFGFPAYATDPNNCGACSTVCNLAHAVNGCHIDAAYSATKGSCYVVQCANTPSVGYNYVPTPGTCPTGSTTTRDGPSGIGCNYTCPVWPSTSSEVCDGKDNNCNGMTDELAAACAGGMTAPAGLCANQGQCSSSVCVAPGCTIPTVCTGASGWECDYSKVPGVELDGSTPFGKLLFSELKCDGLDGNCNGVTDLDGFPNKGQTCTAGVGICRNTGSFVCNGTNTATQCSVTANANAAVDELCNGLDDDCDGQVDERVPVAGTQCFNGGQHACKGWLDPMEKVTVGASSVYVYSYEASRPDANATSPGGNSSRACSKPTVQPWNEVTLTQAQAACAAVRDSKNQPLRLCTAAEWQTTCEDSATPASTQWSYSTGAASYTANVCNDNAAGNPGKPWATASGPTVGGKTCSVAWPGGSVYDLSGNLAEWTSTTVTNGGTTYYKVRGGAYDSPSGGTSCEFDFDILPATFANANVGFRCCAGNAMCGDTTSDPNNCGSCGNVCPAGATKCQAGACVASCSGAGITDCSGSCVNESNDSNHCGSCTNVCPTGQTCVSGACTCGTGFTKCGSVCVNEQTDSNNCGACNRICSGGTPICMAGNCVASCSGSTPTQCGQSCVSLQNDNNNCGACGTVCGSGQICASGTCCGSSSVCPALPATGPYTCVNFQTDNNHCGVCGTACGANSSCQGGICCATGLTNCGGACVNLLTDKNNCNVCGNVCATSCTNGSCCGAGLLECGSQCVNPTNDPQNCGTCFNACSGTTPTCTPCMGSSCAVPGKCCATGKTNCSGTCTDTTSDPANCGGCGISCGSLGTCTAGTCQCPPYYHFCNGQCIFTADDPNNCGGCGTTATPANAAHICTGTSGDCFGSLCQATCQFGYTACDNGYGAGLRSCTDTSVDRNNCGGCGIKCLATQGCINGGCANLTTQTKNYDATAGGLCPDGLGPPITLTDGTNTQCAGNIAATTFSFGICACQTFNGGGQPTIDAFDSTVEPFANTPLANQIGGGVGVNSAFTNSSRFNVSGDVVAFSTLNLGNTTIGERLQCEGNITGGNYTVGGSTEAKTISGGAGAVGQNTTLWGTQSFPDHNLYTAGTCPVGGWTEANGGTCKAPPATPWVDLLEPCKRCNGPGSPDCDTQGLCQVTINTYITYYKTHNNNTAIGLSAAGTDLSNVGADTMLELPCGYYYLTTINDPSGGGHTIDINVHGNTALFVDGDINDHKPINFYIDPKAHLDMFVRGNMLLANNNRLGNMNVPANMRFYVSSPGTGAPAMAFQCAPAIMGLGIYVPNSGFSQSNSLTFYGALFARDYLGGGSMSMHYDKAFADQGLNCPPPTSGCTTCLDCGNQACNCGNPPGVPCTGGTGSCGGCTSDAQCCSPLRCVGGTCVFSSF